MAVGDVVSAVVSLTNASTYYIQATSGQDWVVHNVYHARNITLNWFNNGVIVGSMGTLDGPNIETNLQFHVNNSLFVVIAADSAQVVGYDGIQTR